MAHLTTISTIAAALSDASRFRALLALRHGELCLCHLIALLRLAPSTVSKHMTILDQANLIVREKRGKWQYCRLNESNADARAAMRWIESRLDGDPQTDRDIASLNVIHNTSMEVLCAPYKNGNPACCSSAPATPVAVKWPKAGAGRSTARRSKRTPQASSRTASTRSRSRS